MRKWLSDSLFRTVMRNAGYLMSGKLAGALLGLVSLACAGRGLSPALFGCLMIVHAYASGAGALTKFQTWQFIIRAGAPALQRGDEAVARDAIRFAFGLDLASGLIGMIAAMALLPLLAGSLGLTRDQFGVTLFYCTLVPTMTAATPTGVLRLLDRFDLVGAQQTVTPVVRAIGSAIAYFADLGFVGFAIAWYVGDLLGDLVTWVFAARELRRRNMSSAFRPGLIGTARRLPGAWGFVWTTNIAHSVYGAWGPLGNLVVASVLGPAAAGLYKIASTLMSSSAKPADLLARGFYPEIMRLDPRSLAPWRLGARMAALSASVGMGLVLVVMIGGKPVIEAVFGHRYLASYGLLQIMAWSLLVSTAAFPLESLLYMVGRQKAALVAQLSAAAIYLLLLYRLTMTFGLLGAGYAFLLGTIANGVLMLLPTVGSFRTRDALPSGVAAAR